MNRVTREPDEFPELPDELLELAKELGWIVVFFVCVTSVDPENQDSVSFAAAIPTVPQIGSLIRLEDGAVCRVEKVLYSACRDNGLLKMTPNVYAVFELQLRRDA
jgi:hypothetical protein